jgi:putative membrane protein
VKNISDAGCFLNNTLLLTLALYHQLRIIHSDLFYFYICIKINFEKMSNHNKNISVAGLLRLVQVIWKKIFYYLRIFLIRAALRIRVLLMQLKLKPTEEDKDKKKAGRLNPSRIRDHLANERTYLAWMRTAIALLGFGVVIVRLRTFQVPLIPRPGNGWKLGLVFSLVGLITVWLSTAHYFAVRRDIEEDTYEPTDRWVLLFSLAVMILGAGVIYFVFTTSLDPTSPLIPE